MSKNLEVIHNILGLLPTIEEGLNHIKQQLSELRYEEASIILQDAMLGIASIESALKPIEIELEALQHVEIIRTKQDLNQHMSKVVVLYEIKKYEELEKNMDTVLDAFSVWRQAIEQIIRPKIVS